MNHKKTCFLGIMAVALGAMGMAYCSEYPMLSDQEMVSLVGGCACDFCTERAGYIKVECYHIVDDECHAVPAPGDAFKWMCIKWEIFANSSCRGPESPSQDCSYIYSSVIQNSAAWKGTAKDGNCLNGRTEDTCESILKCRDAKCNVYPDRYDNFYFVITESECENWSEVDPPDPDQYGDCYCSN